MKVSDHIPDNIRRVSKSIGLALWLSETEMWFGLSRILRARLAPEDRAALAFMALRSLDPADALLVARGVLGDGNPPVPPLFDALAAALHWVKVATPDEVEAYCFATFNAMQPYRQADFLRYAERRAAA